MYNPADIKWIKSVTRDGGATWAYREYKVGDIFNLHFPNNPNWFPTNYSRPQPNELIAIFQTLLADEDRIAGTYVTHLVTPTNTRVFDDGPILRPYYRPVMVVGITEPPYIVPNAWSFFKPNRGPICDINTIERRYDGDYTQIQKQEFVWEVFNNLSPKIDSIITAIAGVEEDTDFSAEEGAEKEKLKLHKYKERDRRIIQLAKEKAKKDGRLNCEVCQFDFSVRYPAIGADFIECHHKLPIATGGIRTTKVEDLAMVCANCHRMLHRKHNGGYLTIEQLTHLISK